MGTRKPVVGVFDSKPYDRDYLTRAVGSEEAAWHFHDFRLAPETALAAKMRVLASDPYPNQEWAAKNGTKYVEMSTLVKESDLISLHAPLTPQTDRIINQTFFTREALSEIARVTVENVRRFTSKGTLLEGTVL
jgi:lactate dehydrogenase-like 2-hydroxyacid dehydrogenase